MIPVWFLSLLDRAASLRRLSTPAPVFAALSLPLLIAAAPLVGGCGGDGDDETATCPQGVTCGAGGAAAIGGAPSGGSRASGGVPAGGTGGFEAGTGGGATGGAGGAPSSGTGGTTTTLCTEVDGPAAAALVTSGAVLLDVRTADEFAAGHLEGAINIPVTELETRLSELPPGVAVVAYCRSGNRAAEAAAILCAAGIEVHDLGPMSAWTG